MPPLGTCLFNLCPVLTRPLLVNQQTVALGSAGLFQWQVHSQRREITRVSPMKFHHPQYHFPAFTFPFLSDIPSFLLCIFFVFVFVPLYRELQGECAKLIHLSAAFSAEKNFMDGLTLWDQ
jgi:hypothetical protein